jgi:hypothetical protein
MPDSNIQACIQTMEGNDSSQQHHQLAAVSSGMVAAQSQVSSCTGFTQLPLHLQTLLLSWAAAPLDTCKAAAALASDPQLTAQWLLQNRRQPVLAAAKYGLWDACRHLLDASGPLPRAMAYAAVQAAAAAGQEQVITRLLHCAEEPHRMGSSSTHEPFECTAVAAALQLAGVSGRTSTCRALCEAIPEVSPHEAITAAAGRGLTEVVCAAGGSLQTPATPGCQDGMHCTQGSC